MMNRILVSQAWAAKMLAQLSGMEVDEAYAALGWGDTYQCGRITFIPQGTNKGIERQRRMIVVTTRDEAAR